MWKRSSFWWSLGLAILLMTRRWFWGFWLSSFAGLGIGILLWLASIIHFQIFCGSGLLLSDNNLLEHYGWASRKKSG